MYLQFMTSAVVQLHKSTIMISVRKRNNSLTSLLMPCILRSSYTLCKMLLEAHMLIYVTMYKINRKRFKKMENL